MEKVILRPVAITDLTLRYARHMGGNKVRHYALSAVLAMKEAILGSTADGRDLIKRYIESTEEVEVEFLDAPKVSGGALNSGNPIHTEDVTKLVFTQPQDKKVVRALKKLASKQILVQYQSYKSIFEKLYDKFIAVPWNFLFSKLHLWHIGCSALNYKFERKIHLVHFLTVACDFDELPKAFEALRLDLTLLNDFGLIVGHLAMPSVIALADTVGLGKVPVVLFCFPVINEQKAVDLLKIQFVDLNPQFLKEFGVSYESPEGAINSLHGKPFNEQYEIETVNVGDQLTYEENRQAQIASYEAAKDLVNEIASKQKEDLSRLEKESHSDTIFEHYVDDNGLLHEGKAVAVAVNVKLTRKE
jgi:hypothetical protein